MATISNPVPIKLLGERVGELAPLLLKYQTLLDDGNLTVHASHLLQLQVNVARAENIFDVLSSRHVESPEEVARSIKDLLQCARHAHSTIYNSSAHPVPYESTGLVDRLDTFLKKDLETDPILEDDHDDPLEDTKEYVGKELCRQRDSLGRGCTTNKPLCPFTDLPLAQVAHIIPINTAGAGPSRIWFWLWLAVIFPAQDYECVWKSCQGYRNSALGNLITMSTPIHGLYDQMKISFKPIMGNETTGELKLMIESNTEDTGFKFEGLRHQDGQRFDDNPILTWRIAPDIPEAKRGCYEPPSALLFDVHRYFCHLPRILLIQAPPPPPPIAEGSEELLADWALMAGNLRATSKQSSRQVTPLPGGMSPAEQSSASPIYKRLATKTMSKRRLDTGDDPSSSSPAHSSSSSAKRQKRIGGPGTRGGHSSPERMQFEQYDEDNSSGDYDPESWRFDLTIDPEERCQGYSGPGYRTWPSRLG